MHRSGVSSPLGSRFKSSRTTSLRACRQLARPATREFRHRLRLSLSAAQEAALLARARISIALPLPLPAGAGEAAGEGGGMGAEPALALAVRRLRRRLRREAEEPLLPADPQLEAKPDAGAEEAAAAELARCGPADGRGVGHWHDEKAVKPKARPPPGPASAVNAEDCAEGGLGIFSGGRTATMMAAGEGGSGAYF